MKISKPIIRGDGSDIVYSVDVSFSQGSATLWYRLANKFGDLISDSSDAPLVALLIPAMMGGEDIHIAGRISPRLMYNLSGAYQKLLRQVIPSLHLVNIYPEQVESRSGRSPGVATGFSGGIDSYCLLADHHYSQPVDGFKVTHLLFNNVSGAGGEDLFYTRHRRLEPVVEKLGLPFVRVNSNVYSFYKLRFQQTHTPRNASVAHLLQGGIGRFMYASALPYSNVFVGETHDMAYSDVIALPLLSTEAVDALSVGSEYTRVEKTLRVATSVPDSYTSLDVCVKAKHAKLADKGAPTNCSRCPKCMRTLLTLEIAGIADRYVESFDLDVYQKHRSKYVKKVLMSDDPLMQEIVNFAAMRHYQLDTQSGMYAATMKTVRSAVSLTARAFRKQRRTTIRN